MLSMTQVLDPTQLASFLNLLHQDATAAEALGHRPGSEAYLLTVADAAVSRMAQLLALPPLPSEHEWERLHWEHAPVPMVPEVAQRLVAALATSAAQERAFHAQERERWNEAREQLLKDAGLEVVAQLRTAEHEWQKTGQKLHQACEERDAALTQLRATRLLAAPVEQRLVQAENQLAAMAELIRSATFKLTTCDNPRSRTREAEALLKSEHWKAARTWALPLFLWCPECHRSHVDKGEFATRLHTTHRCEHCKHEWKPFESTPTVGVNPRAALERESFNMLCWVAEVLGLPSPNEEGVSFTTFADAVREVARDQEGLPELDSLLKLQHRMPRKRAEAVQALQHQRTVYEEEVRRLRSIAERCGKLLEEGKTTDVWVGLMQGLLEAAQEAIPEGEGLGDRQERYMRTPLPGWDMPILVQPLPGAGNWHEAQDTLNLGLTARGATAGEATVLMLALVAQHLLEQADGRLALVEKERDVAVGALETLRARAGDGEIERWLDEPHVEPLSEDHLLRLYRNYLLRDWEKQCAPNSASRSLSSLLAHIHGDGGEYEAQHGQQRAVAVAFTILQQAQLRNERLPEALRLLTHLMKALLPVTAFLGLAKAALPNGQVLVGRFELADERREPDTNPRLLSEEIEAALEALMFRLPEQDGRSEAERYADAAFARRGGCPTKYTARCCLPFGHTHEPCSTAPALVHTLDMPVVPAKRVREVLLDAEGLVRRYFAGWQENSEKMPSSFLGDVAFLRGCMGHALELLEVADGR